MQYFPKNNKTITFQENVNLTYLANKLETDKGDADRDTLSWSSSFPTHHTNGYTNTYEKYMSNKRSDHIRLLEIGICDQRFPLASIKMWLSYFQDVDLYCVDNFWGRTPSQSTLNDIQNMGANIFVADQGSESDWNNIEQILLPNTVDFIIEDGSHYPSHMLYTLWRSINLLKTGGYYFMEDIQDPPTTGGMYGFDNTCIHLTINQFATDNIFRHSLLTESQSQDIERSFKLIEIHTGGPKHCQAHMAVLQKII